MKIFLEFLERTDLFVAAVPHDDAVFVGIEGDFGG